MVTLAAKSILSLFAAASDIAVAWLRETQAQRHRYVFERAVRKNGSAWLVESRELRKTPSLPLTDIGDALRAHFTAICGDQLPTHLLDLTSRIAIASK
jgi:hypothetical protein